MTQAIGPYSPHQLPSGTPPSPIGQLKLPSFGAGQPNLLICPYNVTQFDLSNVFGPVEVLQSGTEFFVSYATNPTAFFGVSFEQFNAAIMPAYMGMYINGF